MLANSFKFKSAQGPYTNPLAFLNSEISCQCFLYRVYGQWSVLLFSLGKLVNGYIRHWGGLRLSWLGVRTGQFFSGCVRDKQTKDNGLA